jgi:hypothetical protein
MSCFRVTFGRLLAGMSEAGKAGGEGR